MLWDKITKTTLINWCVFVLSVSAVNIYRAQRKHIDYSIVVHCYTWLLLQNYMPSVQALISPWEPARRLATPVNNVWIASYCLLNTILNHEFNPNCYDWYIRMRALQKQSGTTRTTWKSASPHRRFDAEIDTITSSHYKDKLYRVWFLRRYTSYPMQRKHSLI